MAIGDDLAGAAQLPTPEQTAQMHAQELMAAIHDNPRFDAAIAKLQADRSMKHEHVQGIANSFLGYSPSGPAARTRSGLIREITDRQMVEQRQRARGQQIDKMKAW